jgi:hypothetical protein
MIPTRQLTTVYNDNDDNDTDNNSNDPARPNMISAVNTILCAIACSDLIVNVSNIPYLLHELIDMSNASYYSFFWAHYILIHAHLTVTAHTISIWLTCALATWRYCVIR